jgi:hypothetical protein
VTAAATPGVLERALAGLPAGLSQADVPALARRLYAEWYAGTEPSAVEDPADDATEALRAAHAGAARFEPGWRAERVSSAGRVLATRDGETRLLHPLDYVCAGRPGLPPAAGGEVLAVARRDSPEPVDGYWMTWGRSWSPDGDQPPLVRVYWNVPVEGAPALVGALTAALEPVPVPWMLKLPQDVRQHERADAAVLYLPRRDFAAAAPALASAARALRDHLVEAEPPLALRLAPGVALAEDPGSDESFGMKRCRLIAEAVAISGSAAPGGIRARFVAAGLDPERPHLEPGSTAGYDWPRALAGAPAPAAPTRLPLPAPAEPEHDEAFLAAATAVAGRLADEAIWSGDRCTWVGDALEPTDGAWSVVLRACGGDLYAGTSGIAWFLARVDDERARAAAAGAARHALRWAAREPGGGGLYEGPLGALHAVVEVADALGDGALREAAAEVATAALDDAAERSLPLFDLLAGEAGTVVAALALERALGAGAARVATAAGDRLLAAARRGPAGWWWGAPGAAAGLCGLAHGGSGIALALAALARRTGEARFGEAAREAVRWERRWFSRAAGGWPDLRTEVRDGNGGRPAYPALWCHGAVGAGLARLAIGGWERECATLAEAGAAIQATRRATSAALSALVAGEPGEDANWSLCHGLAGSAELLLGAWEVLGHPDHLSAARRIGAAALRDGDGGAGPWRCGVPQGGGETPGLMLGLAGIGATLLRLHDPRSLPSPLLYGLR